MSYTITETGPVILKVTECCHECGAYMQPGEDCFLLSIDYSNIDGYCIEYYVHFECLAQHTEG